MTAVRSGADRRARLERARLYLVLDVGGRAALAPALGAGAHVVQLRDKDASDDLLLETGAWMRDLAARHGALFVVNDRPDLALALTADGIHVGQEDESPAQVREQVGADVLVGLSTHSPGQFDAGLESEADYLSAGPVHATPTKPGRPATGLGLIEHAAARATKPFFAIGGIDDATVGAVLAAGARRVVVVRAIRDAADPGAAAAGLRARLEAATAEEAGVGTR